MKTLQKAIEEFSFADREKKNGKTVGNKCGRDFLYYALNFHYPDEFNAAALSPAVIDSKGLFGTAVPAWLAWSQIQFADVARFLADKGLRLQINNQNIGGYDSFVSAILFSRKSYNEAIEAVEIAIDTNQAVGIDVSLGMFGLLDHVLFVYGYDEENFYVFDTHQVAGLEYEPIEDNHYFRLPKKVIKDRWTRFGRVWKVDRT